MKESQSDSNYVQRYYKNLSSTCRFCASVASGQTIVEEGPRCDDVLDIFRRHPIEAEEPAGLGGHTGMAREVSGRPVRPGAVTHSKGSMSLLTVLVEAKNKIAWSGDGENTGQSGPGPARSRQGP
ncbi:hypothetical protein WN51_10509 [Melipona quadrifasciata]|uniref:Uncharacterized protein n=1 Tax=Melipona quadrifasciata TaxID=166423 RepID=A0A0M9A4K8_9HYME|nr:hypothetical protein WN51_10509 [Melipona quadrifasciata]